MLEVLSPLWRDLVNLGRAISKFNQEYVHELMGVPAMALISKDQLWQINDMTYEDVPVPEWGPNVEIRLRTLTGEELDAYQATLVVRTRDGGQKMNLRNASARLLVACAINEDGSPLFEAKDVMRLSQMSARALQKLTVVAQRLSGMTEDDMKELTENFDGDQSESSTSG